MIVVTGIKYAVVQGNTAEAAMEKLAPGEFGTGRVSEFTREILRGQVFTNEDGVDVLMAWNSDVQNTIGLAMSTFDRNRIRLEENRTQLAKDQELIKHLNQEVVRISARVSTYERLNWKQRIAFLFRGQKYQIDSEK